MRAKMFSCTVRSIRDEDKLEDGGVGVGAVLATGFTNELWIQTPALVCGIVEFRNISYDHWGSPSFGEGLGTALLGKLYSALWGVGFVVAATGAGLADDLQTKSPWLQPGFFIYGSVDGIDAHRNSGAGQIAHPLGSTASAITEQSLAFGNITGPYDLRVGAGYRPFGIEVRELGGFQWKSSANYGALGNIQLGSFSNFGTTNVTGSAISKFDSREADFRFQLVPWLTTFVGYRQLTMYDQADFTVVFPAFNALYDFNVPWKAQGAQIGAEARLFGPGTSWAPWPVFADVDARIGLLSVSGSTNFDLYPSTGGVFGPYGASFNEAEEVMSEFGASLGYQLGPNIELRAGYRFLSIPDAPFSGDYAAASTAAHTEDLLPGPRRLDLQMVTIGTRILLPAN
jgi:hypothetical protein